MTKDIRKHRYLEVLGILIILLALVRCVFPNIGRNDATMASADSLATDSAVNTELVQQAENNAAQQTEKGAPQAEKNVAQAEKNVAQQHGEYARYRPDGERPHRIVSVPSYRAAFPDSNNVQLEAANRWGIRPLENRGETEKLRDKLVYIGSSPYYSLDPLYSSIPYLVPRAAVLLQDIGQTFFDSLQVKGVPLHRFIVTSVLRTKSDVSKLRRRNGNATENSCHMYGTTFDISYVRYQTVEDPEGAHRRKVRDDSLKFILSEVLNDMRQNKRCYIKYEVKQGCYHITVR